LITDEMTDACFSWLPNVLPCHGDSCLGKFAARRSLAIALRLNSVDALSIALNRAHESGLNFSETSTARCAWDKANAQRSLRIAVRSKDAAVLHDALQTAWDVGLEQTEPAQLLLQKWIVRDALRAAKRSRSTERFKVAIQQAEVAGIFCGEILLSKVVHVLWMQQESCLSCWRGWYWPSHHTQQQVRRRDAQQSALEDERFALANEARQREANRKASEERARQALEESQKMAMERRGNVTTLYHATKRCYANSICSQQRFIPGRGGFLGPGIYFSRSPSAARAFSRCHGSEVVVQCDVSLGRLAVVERGNYSQAWLSSQGYDSLKEGGRDCYMLPRDDGSQIANICVSGF